MFIYRDRRQDVALEMERTKQQPSIARSGHQISCCLVFLHFLCDILAPITVQLRRSSEVHFKQNILFVSAEWRFWKFKREDRLWILSLHTLIRPFKKLNPINWAISLQPHFPFLPPPEIHWKTYRPRLRGCAACLPLSSILTWLRQFSLLSRGWRISVILFSRAENDFHQGREWKSVLSFSSPRDGEWQYWFPFSALLQASQAIPGDWIRADNEWREIWIDNWVAY